MIPILYEANETSFLTNGLGRLPDAISCTVTEERNGQFELEMTYPLGGAHFDEIRYGRLICAVPADGKDPQPFSIYRISKPINGIVKIYAEHVSYQLTRSIAKPYTATGIAQAFTMLGTNTVTPHPFNITHVDIVSNAEFELKSPASVRSVLGGLEGSFVDTFGGEWEWDKYTCYLRGNRGSDYGVTLRYGKNLIDLTQEENIQSTYTGIVPYWKGLNAANEEDFVFLEEDPANNKHAYIEKAEVAQNFPYKRMKLVDLTERFDGQPDDDELRTEAEAYLEEDTEIGKPDINLTVSFAALWQTEEYKDVAPLERVNLCDTVSVVFEELGVSATAKVVKTVYNVLLDRYDSIELGNTKDTITKTIQTSITAVKEKIEEEVPTKTFLQKELDEATEKIRGGLGGYILMKPNANGEPEEIYVMDTDSKDTATKVMRINKNGIAFWQGQAGKVDDPGETFNSAWTIDGTFTSQFINTWELTADIINTGMLRRKTWNPTTQSYEYGNCFFDLVNDVLVCSDLEGIDATGQYGNLIVSIYNNARWGTSTESGLCIYREGNFDNRLIINPPKSGAGSSIKGKSLSIMCDQSGSAYLACMVKSTYSGGHEMTELQGIEFIPATHLESEVNIYGILGVDRIQATGTNSQRKSLDIYGDVTIHGNLNYGSQYY